MSEEQLRKYLRKVTGELQGAHRRIHELERQGSESIAIVGAACRYPGGVSSPEGVWEVAAEGRDCIVELPDDRGWPTGRLYDPDPDAVGKTSTRHGGFLEDAAGFDSAFFGIAPREALAMDPQQRLLLESAWQALEDAGIDPLDLHGSLTGVFAGLASQDYASGSATGGAADAAVEGMIGVGGTTSVASGRLAYSLGLEGPAVSVDTACSSSLVAMHLAAQALRGGECDLALAGGAAVMATPGIFVQFSRQRAMSPDGRCKSFSADADGAGFSEGCGLLLLERLSDAKRNNRRILATIKGSAINQDGASNGLTAPNGPSQERVIRQALANAGLKPSEVDAVEAHGTGTVLGDPIEAQALLATYGQERDNGPLALGSLKSNIGHTQAAAGVGGVIKMVMALREEELPPTLHAAEPTPHVDWSSGEIELLNKPREWKRGGRPRRAGVSSFGISGTNAHVIIEEPPELPSPQRDEEARPPAIPWAISAKTPEALRDYAGKLAAHAEKTDQDPVDVAHTLLASRASLSHRAVVVGSDKEELLQGLDALVKGSSHRGLATAKATQGKTAFLLSGQGSQRAQMGKELYAAFPTYAKAFDRACEALQEHLPFSVKDAVFAEAGTELSSTLARTDVTQASIFALQLALYELISSFGPSPDYLIGHSIGELSAAHLSGVLSLQDAAKLVAARGTLMAALPQGGAMASIRASEQEARESLKDFEGRLAIAAVNSPSSVSVSGEEEALEEWEALQGKAGKKTKRLDVSHAFHSQLIEPMLQEFEQIASELSFDAPRIPIVSNVTAEELTDRQATSPAYWASQIREAVCFAKGIQHLEGKGVSRFLELGAGTTLTALAAETLEEEEATFAPSLGKDAPEPTSFIAALGAMHASGAKPDFKALLGEPPQAPTELPTYPFQRRRYWLEAGQGAGDPSALGLSAADHPLLGASISLAAEGTHLFTGRISQKSHPWVKDHAVGGNVLLPGTAFAEMALTAGAQVGAERLEELILEAPLVLPEDGAVQVQLTLRPTEQNPGAYEIEIHSRPEPGEEEDQEPSTWTRHASGTLAPQAEPLQAAFDATVWPPPGAEPIAVEDFYDRVADIGLEYGSAFLGMEAAWRLGEELYAEVSLAEEQQGEAERFGLHPALLDAALHASMLDADPERGLRLPFSFAGVSLGEAGAAKRLRLRIVDEEGRIRLDAAGPDGAPACSIASLAVREVDPTQLQVATMEPDALLALEWIAVEPGDGESRAETFECRTDPDLDPAAAAHALTARALERLHSFLADEEAPDASLAFITEGAMAVSEGDAPDPAAAAVWGLVRSAQAEHPGRFLLVDLDPSEASGEALAGVLAQREEPQLALREGIAMAPRLVPAKGADENPPQLASDGTVLITGGLSGLGAIAARHLADAHGVERILLTSRRGSEAPGAGELIAELAELGCEATAVACDVSDREQLQALLAEVSAEHPLTAVVHCAGIVDDGTIGSLDPDRLDAVLAPKADAAWHLHELTRGAGLADFVLYSSGAAVLGSPGQGNYAAANSFLDALAQSRRAEGLPAHAIAWGMWEAESGMTAELDEADRARLARAGLAPIAAEAGTRLLDRALSRPASFSAALPFDRNVLRTVARAGLLPPLLTGLAPSARRRTGVAGGALAGRLAAMPAAEWESTLLEIVREQAASVLGHASVDAVDPRTSFKDLGFDSLGAVELRNRLATATGVRLDATIVFDYPTPEAVARFLLDRFRGEAGGATVVRASRGADEPIAIVGLSCRYPGGVSSPESMWSLLASGRDGIGPFPEDRGWDVERIYDPDPERAGKTYTRHGGFLEDLAEFDPAFFSFGPREALGVDPQQRLLLEASWEALEDAGVAPESLRGANAGVFAGVMYHDYAGGAGAGAPELEAFGGTGIAGSVASGRVSYALGLEGPAVSIDTACSSSLVATHLAAQALRSGECDLALAGGVTAMATPIVFIGMSRQRALATDGRCKSFGADADGTGWSEGCGLLLLERLSDAKRNKRRILATIKGSATNQDGASNGLTAPNGPSQERVIRQALANAGLKPSEVDAVEAHGTGTVLGDPIEAQALLATYGQDRDNGPLALGSLKSNIGHTQAAAGVGGVIKMVMALREEELPRTLHAEEPTPHVDWSSGEVELLSEAKPWKRGERPRRAAVSSFGISGTNAHLIIEEPPERPAPQRDEKDKPPVIPWAISAKTPEALKDYAGKLAAHAEQADQDRIDVAHTLLASRASLPHRAVVVGHDKTELLEGLDALRAGKASPNLVQGNATSHTKIAFVFPGQGSQWAGMARGLLEESPLFVASMTECDEALGEFLEASILNLIRSDSEQWLGEVQLVQPALFATMVSLARLWGAYGVRPAAVVGHSQGEIAAAVVAGALSLEDGARLAALRAKALIPLMGKGEMASFALSADELEEKLAPYGDRVSIAAHNGPRSTVCSGEPKALQELVAACEEEGRRARIIPVGYASHCAQIEQIEAGLKAGIETIEPQAAEIPFLSTLSGEPLETTELDAAYWYRNLREPVRFQQASEELLSDGFTAFVEISCHPVLSLALRETIEAAGSKAISLQSLRRDEGDTRRFLTSLAQAHADGVEVDFSPLLGEPPLAPAQLPTYSFQRQRYWLDAARGSADLGAAGQRAADHPLLGATIALVKEGEHLFTGRISQQTHPWTKDHAVTGTVILPGTAFVEMALRAGAEVGAERLQELVLETPLHLPEGAALQIQLTLRAGEQDPEAYALEIHSRPEPGEEEGQEPSPWTRHASGALVPETEPLRVAFDATAWPPPGAEPIPTEDFYDHVAEIGIEYGPAFQGMEAAWRLGNEFFAEVSLAAEQAQEADRFGVHPALLDAAHHPIFFDVDPAQGVHLPFSFAGLALGEARGASAVRARVVVEDERIHVEATDPDGVPAFTVASVAARRVDPSQLRIDEGSGSDALYALRWSEVELPAAQDPGRDSEAAGAVEAFECVPPASPDPAHAAHSMCAEVLERLQAFLGEEEKADSRLAILTEGAMAVDEGEAPDPAGAAVWGLVRSAQSEHPGRFLLVDTDGSATSKDALARALAIEEEPQLALRGGVASVPRLAAIGSGEEGEPAALDPEGTVLVTGGLTGLGALTARHLASGGVRHLLLASRRGAEAPGGAELIAELAEHGCEATAVACDVSDREQVAAMLGGVAPEHPLVAVFHSAGTADNALVQDLSREQLDTVLAPKADAAWHLHELTAGMELSRFVLFSSIAGTFDNPGQGNYAAANSFLDALARRRRADGLAATAIAWGPWLEGSELAAAAEIRESDLARLRRDGFRTLSTELVLELLDRVPPLARAHALAAPLDLQALRVSARAGLLPPLLTDLVPAGRRRSRAGGSLARRLATVAEADREEIVLDLVREHVAAVLGHPSVEAIEPEAVFKDLGFDSLGAVELRNRLAQATGVPLEATLAFDYPSPTAVARHILDRVDGKAGAEAVAVRPARANEEPIAIVGVACRYPGGVDSADGLWELLAAGRDAIGEFPDDRGWEVERIYDPDPQQPGKTITRHGGFLADAAEFDPTFFGIGPREALAMDPQQRLLLECAWEAIESAGVDPTALGGSMTGVFIGIMLEGYGWSDGPVAPELEPYLGGSGAGGVAPGRIAYTLGLEGPAVAVNTACSSSLVAMHLAAQALRSGECELALAGGATVMPTPRMFTQFSRQQVLSPDGRCRAFGVDADGAGFAEGSGLVLLERLSDARRNRRRILATIRGSASNQDGASNGLTAPNGPSQERVIRQALANAGLSAKDVDAVEAHGTGTTLGDPIEAQALLATYGKEREGVPLRVGSLKSNVGHTQAAAGVGGVIKMVMALREEELPRTLHAEEPTPHVDWSSGEIELLSEPSPWKRGERPRRAGISSFGMTGTNAHLILEEPPEQPTPPADRRRPPAIPWAISAKTPEALRDHAGRLAAHVERSGSDSVDVAHTLLASRASLPVRAVIAGADTDKLLAGLDALVGGKASPSLVRAKVTQGKTAFLFSGQGSQRARMGSGLYDAFPVYREAFDEASMAVEAALGLAVKDTVFAEAGGELSDGLGRTDLTQASLFCLQVALFRLLASYGARPDFLIGHSIGELTAAHLAGVLSLHDAAKLVAARGRLMADLPPGGAMASIRASEEEVEEGLRPFEGRLGIAAVNAPTAIVVSGDEEALSEWEAIQAEAGRKTKRLRVSHAFHSQLMEPMLEEFAETAARLDFNPPTIPIVSNLSGEELSDEQATSPAYWAAHVRGAVRFADGIAALADRGVGRFLELGPDATLTALSLECLQESALELTVAPTLRREEPEPVAFVAGLGALHASGGAVDLSALLEDASPAQVELPTYPFQRQRYWLDPAPGVGDLGAVGLVASEHPLLGAAISVAGGESHVVTARLSQRTHPWTKDHVLGGVAILPATAFCELALSAGEAVGARRLDELLLEAPLEVPAAGAVQLQLSLVPRPDSPETFDVAIHSRPEDDEELPWVRHASGVLTAAEPLPPAFDATAWPPPGAEPLPVDAFYDSAAAAGLEYGPAFQGLEAAWKRDGELFAEVSLAEEQEAEAARFGVHPALLDAAGHAALIDTVGEDGVPLPFGFEGISLGEGRGASRLRVRISAAGERPRLDAADEDGLPAVSIASLISRLVDPAELGGRAAEPDSLFRIEWRAMELPSGGDAIEPIGDAADLRAALAADEDAGLLVFAPAAGAGEDDDAAAALSLTGEALELIQAFLANERTAGSRLAFLTEKAVAVADGELPEPAAAALWGLVRSAQSEHPGRFVLLDSDGSEASRRALPAALAQEGEAQLALREGSASVPRLVSVLAAGAPPADEPVEAGAAEFDPEGTVLVSGGLSGLGALTARHLAGAPGAKHMVLTSRRGPDAPGAGALIAELAELGCEARAVACDLADRRQVEAMLAAIPAEQPLTAVVHSAGTIDDGTLLALDRERLAAVLAPKAAGAWNLHQLTRQAGLSAFVLYSSGAAVLGSPGQANYAAANAFLDALAQRRRAEGLAGLSIGWGHWQEESEMTSSLGEADLARFRRLGIAPIDAALGLRLLDRARGRPEAFLAAVRIDPAALRATVRAGLAPPILSALVPAARRRSPGAKVSLESRLAAVPEAKREAFVLDLVRDHVAAVLGHDSARAIDPSAPFKDLGFDSLGAVELRNRLAEEAGVRLDATLVFDYPTPEAIAGYLLAQAGGPAADPADAEDADVRRVLAAIPVARLKESGLLEMLLALTSGDGAEVGGAEGSGGSEIDEMDIDDLVRKTLEASEGV